MKHIRLSLISNQKINIHHHTERLLKGIGCALSTIANRINMLVKLRKMDISRKNKSLNKNWEKSQKQKEK